MSTSSNSILAAEEALTQLLDHELQEIITSITSGFGEANNPYTIQLPENYTVDLPLEELASLVARTANSYGRAARAAGIARAQAKLAKGRFEKNYKRNRVGKNDSEREATAMTACADDHTVWTMAEAIAAVADGIESGSRVASESIRKIYGSAEAQYRANAREGVVY